MYLTSRIKNGNFVVKRWDDKRGMEMGDWSLSQCLKMVDRFYQKAAILIKDWYRILAESAFQ